MEQPLKQRLIGAVILISLAVIFVPMLIGNKPNSSQPFSIEIPEPPKNIDSRILVLPEQEKEELAEVSISKDAVVEIKKPTIPAPPPKKSVEGLTAWVVQVGSFSDQKNADALSTKLKSAGFSAFVEQMAGKSGDVYRVRIGPELSKEKADAMKLTLHTGHQLKNAIVVKYP
ncbi:MAG: sporulation-like protein [Cycloclasticus sp.]|nr:MAG: sporulation-like protein [Cycloclasticus sp.]